MNILKGSNEEFRAINKLRDSFVIFICTFDPFDSNLSVYSFRNRCDEQTSIVLNDGTEKVFVNVTAWSSVEQKELQALLRYFESGTITDKYTENIEKSVASVRNGEKWRTEYMTFEMKLREVREDAYEEGREEGKIELIAGLVKDKIITLSDAAKRMSMTEDELRKMIKK